MSINGSVDASQLSALQRLSLENKAKKSSSGTGSLASFARKPGSQPTLASAGLRIAASKPSSLAAIASKRRSGEDTKNAAVSIPRTPNSQVTGNSSLSDAKASKLAQKIKLAHSISDNRTNIAENNSVEVDGVRHTPHPRLGRPSTRGDVDSRDALFQAPSRGSVLATSTAHFAPFVSPSPFGSLLVAGWHTPVSNQSVFYAAPSETRFLFDSPSPDDLVQAKRAGTRLARVTKEREGH